MPDLRFSDTISGSVRNGVLVVTIDNPPVNATSADVRAGLMAAAGLILAMPLADAQTATQQPEAPAAADTAPFVVAAEVLGAIRRAKSAAQQSMKAEVARLEVAGPVRTLEGIRADLTAAGNVRDWSISEAEELSATVSL